MKLNQHQTNANTLFVQEPAAAFAIQLPDVFNLNLTVKNRHTENSA